MAKPDPSSDSSKLLATGDLLTRARSGERQAIEALVVRYRQPLEHLLHLRLVPNARRLLETQDLVQEVLTRALRLLPRFEYRGIGSFWSYLRSVALNYLREAARKGSRQEPLTSTGDGADLKSSDPGPLQETCRREEFLAFEKALTRLTERAREALLLRIELEQPYGVIASECGFPSAGAARMAIMRAIKQVSQEMGRDGFKE